MANKNNQLDNAISIVCDECGYEINEENIILRTMSIEGKGSVGLKKTYFCCPKCGHTYNVDVTDSFLRVKIRELKALIRKQQRLIAKGSSKIRLKNNLDKITMLREDIHRIESDLKRKWL